MQQKILINIRMSHLQLLAQTKPLAKVYMKESAPSAPQPQLPELHAIPDKMAPPEQVTDSNKNTWDKPPVPQQTPVISEKRRLKRKIGDTEPAQDEADSSLCSDEEPNSTPKARKRLCMEDSPDDDQEN